MNIEERLHTVRQEYIDKYKTNPNVIFVGCDLLAEPNNIVDGQKFYDATPENLWGAHIIMVLTPNYIKFAEHSDIKKAIKHFNADNSWESYKIEKNKTIVASVGIGQHISSKLEVIEFSKNEIEMYSMQNN